MSIQFTDSEDGEGASSGIAGKLRGWTRGILAGIILALFVVGAFWVIEGAIRVSIYDSYVETIATRTGLNRYLVNILWAVFLIPFYLGIHYALQIWSRQKRWTGATILIVLYVIYNAGLYAATRNHYRGKWYVRTQDGIKYYDQRTESGRDPVYGYKLKRVTPEKIPELIALEDGCNTVNPQGANFFNTFTEDAQVWYYKTPNGEYDFFDGPCYHPELGVRLKPVTRSVVQDWKQQASSSGKQDERQLQPPQEEQRSETDQDSEVNDNEPTDTETGGTERQESRRSGGEPRENNRTEQTREVRREYRQRYLDLSLLERLRGSGPIALVEMEGETSFEYSLVEDIRSRGINARSGLLKSTAFQSLDVSRGLTGGNTEMLNRLGLSKLSGYLLFCRLSLREPEPGELYKARANLSVILVSLEGGRPIRKEFEARGGGFDPADARGQARERVRSDFLASSIVDRLTRH